MNYQLPKVGLLLALAVVWIGFALAPKPALAASLPATTCTATGPTSRTCDLWAKSTTINLTGTVNATVWAYADTAGGVPTLPGPLLIVNQGDSVTVNLTNLLPETTALSFLGQNIRPDRVGVAPNGSKSYQFVASKPGTFIYEAGLLSNAQHQVAMGLAGVLIVRPNPATQAYASAASAFDDEAVVFLNEVDLQLNNSANPANFDMRNFTPRYRLINGKVHPNTLPIETQPGKRVLLRYVNAGLQFHAMSVLGVRQSLLAMDGSAYPRARRTIAQTLSPGQTMDVIATVPAPLTADSNYPLYDANLILNNNGANSLAWYVDHTSCARRSVAAPD
ncbi:MAG: multicopper oxidase family protein [Caldilineaceae bacterium]